MRARENVRGGSACGCRHKRHHSQVSRVWVRACVCVCVRARGCEVVGPVTPTAVPIFSNVLYVGSVRERERGRERERARAHVRGGGVCGCRQQCQLLHHSFQSEWCLQLNWYLRMCRGMSCRVETTRVMSCGCHVVWSQRASDQVC